MAERDNHNREIDSDEAAAIAARQIGDPELEARLKELSPQQIAVFVTALNQAMRKRRLMLLGYLAALASIILGLVFALLMYADHEPGTFIGWVFFVPFLLAGASLYLFGRLADRIKIKVGDIQIDAKGRRETST